MIYLLFALGALVFPCLLIHYDSLKIHRTALVLKTLASLSFVLLGLLGQMKTSGLFAEFIFWALICGFIGDILLQVRHLYHENMLLFFLGGGIFLLGHVFYIAALLLKLEGDFILPLLMGLTAAGIAAFRLRPLMNMSRTYRFMFIFYLVFVISFAVFACTYAFRKQTLSAILTGAGALLFASSDLILIYEMVSPKKHLYNNAVLLALYYLGQCLIALSLSV